MPTGHLLEALDYFREAWRGITNHITDAVRGHMDTYIESSNDRPGDLAGRGRPFMRTIVEFVRRYGPQNVAGEVVLNRETVLVELERAGSSATGHCFSPESFGSAAEWDSRYNPLPCCRRNIPAWAH